MSEVKSYGDIILNRTNENLHFTIYFLKMYKNCITNIDTYYHNNYLLISLN